MQIATILGKERRVSGERRGKLVFPFTCNTWIVATSTVSTLT